MIFWENKGKICLSVLSMYSNYINKYFIEKHRFFILFLGESTLAKKKTFFNLIVVLSKLIAGAKICRKMKAKKTYFIMWNLIF